MRLVRIERRNIYSTQLVANPGVVEAAVHRVGVNAQIAHDQQDGFDDAVVVAHRGSLQRHRDEAAIRRQLRLRHPLQLHPEDVGRALPRRRLNLDVQAVVVGPAQILHLPIVRSPRIEALHGEGADVLRVAGLWQRSFNRHSLLPQPLWDDHTLTRAPRPVFSGCFSRI